MAESDNQATVYHVLLIGISAYPPQYNSLNGCVNDIDAVERLLLDPLGIGIPADQIRIRRLAALPKGAVSTSRFGAETLFPNKQNVTAELNNLAGPEVKPTDRVLIYYSGHGYFKQLPDTPTHEMLVLNGGDDIQFLYDVELNRYLAAIAARTSDLTVVLDCCHSAGATRGILDGEPEGAVRFLVSSDGGEPLPALEVPQMKDLPGGLLSSLESNYLALVACQAEESAHEGRYNGGQSQGALTLALLQLLSPLPMERRAKTRWADIFPPLLDSVGAACASLRQPSQQPALLGRPERRVFGGEWKRQDPGFSVDRLPDGQYSVASGTLLGVTRDAVLAVYGPEPSEFPALGTDADLKARIGMLQVVSAERSTCTAQVVGGPFDPTGARARLVQPGASQRLSVLLKSPDPALSEFLEATNLLRIVSADASDAQVRVSSRSDGGWTIGNDIVENLATVPPEARAALRAGLESYYRYNTVLRLAHSCTDPQLANVLTLRLLDCDDEQALAAADLMNPSLPEAPRDRNGIYHFTAGDRFCIELRSIYNPLLSKPILDANLHATLFDCGAGGEAQYLGETPLLWHQAERQGDRQVVWRLNELGSPFVAGPDFADGGMDRFIAVATTRKDVDLRGLEVDRTVQQVVDEIVSLRGVLVEPKSISAAPAELWTAVTVPLWIGPKKEH
jgi:Caspase domain